MPIVFNENNPIAGKGAIEAVVNLIKDNSNDIADINEDIGGLDDGMENLDNRIGVLEETYNDTMNIANNQLNELIDGKAQIAQALTDRGYPTAPTDSSASMAQKITDMAYDAGWLAQLGYSETNDGGVKEAVAYSKSILDAWENGNVLVTKNDTKLVFAPSFDFPFDIDNSLYGVFSGCTHLVYVPNLDLSHFRSLSECFKSCSSLVYVGKIKAHNKGVYNTFDSSVLERIEELDIMGAVVLGAISEFANCTKLKYMLIKNYASAQTLNGNGVLLAPNWGVGSETNRQSLVDSLLTYSFDRATAGYSACTIKLHADTLARLTAEEIAAITAKGFTLTS